MTEISELWYTLLHLDLRQPHSRDALTDTQAMHKLIQQGFGDVRVAHNILYQVQPGRIGYPPQVLISSTTRPGWGTLNTTILKVDVKDITKQWQSLQAGKRYKFRLVANPVTRNSKGSGNPITNPVDQTLWITKRLQDAAEIRNLSITNPTTVTGNREGATLTHYTVTYSGTLAITDPDRLRHLLATGIGRAKAYGCGLLTLAP